MNKAERFKVGDAVWVWHYLGMEGDPNLANRRCGYQAIEGEIDGVYLTRKAGGERPWGYSIMGGGDYWSSYNDGNVFSSLEDALRYGVERRHLLVEKDDKGRLLIFLIQKTVSIRLFEYWEWSCDVVRDDGSSRPATIQGNGATVDLASLKYL